MAYSQDYRQMVLDKLSSGQTVRSIANELNISTQTVQRWKSNSARKQRLFKPYKIDNNALRRDVEMYPDDYQHERAIRFNCSQRAIGMALKRLAITQKKASKSSKSG